MKKIIIALLIVSLLVSSVAAFASSGIILADSGDTYVRTGPGLGYTTVGVLYRGQALRYTGYYSVDYRGVVWYEICWYSGVAWVSSRYTSLYY